MTDHHIKRVGFYCKKKSGFIFIHFFTLKESCKMFIAEYIPAVRFIISENNSLITTTVEGSIFEKIFKTITWEKNIGKYIYPTSKVTKSNLTLKRFCAGEKLLKLYCTKNVLVKYFEKCCNLFKYFVSHIVIYIAILRDKSKFFVLHNFRKCFSGTRVNQIVILNIWMVVSSFQLVIFDLVKKWCLENFYFIKKEWLSTLPNNLVLIWKF